MKEHPIIFSGPMVRAIQEGRKTQTRRVVKPRIKNAYGFYPADTFWVGEHPNGGFWAVDNPNGPTHYMVRDTTKRTGFPCPYGIPGDRLWVRETFWIDDGDRQPFYKATEEHPEIFQKWKPSIHMPRWASRLTLDVTDIRVERLQEMSFYDWVADFCPTPNEQEKALASFVGASNQRRMAQDLWDSINGKKYPWESNPWVWVVGFKPTHE